MSEEPGDQNIILMTANIVSAYVKNNQVDGEQLPEIINAVHGSLSRLGGLAAEPVNKPRPAVPIKKSVTPEYIVCLEDGKRFKFLKRHLSAAFGMTPAEYRAKWNLPPTYPMIAPNYASPRTRGPYGYTDIYIPDDQKEQNQPEGRPPGAGRKRQQG